MSEKGDQFIEEKSKIKIEILERVITDLKDEVRHLKTELEVETLKHRHTKNQLTELQHKKG